MDSKTPKVESETPGEQCCAATPEELCASTLAHYDDISTKARHWSNQVPQAIKFWYLEKPKLERALAAAEQQIKAIQKDNCALSDIGEALKQRAEAAEEKLRKRNSDIEFAKAIVDLKLVDRAEAAEARAREAEKLLVLCRPHVAARVEKFPTLLTFVDLLKQLDAALASGEQGREK